MMLTARSLESLVPSPKSRPICIACTCTAIVDQGWTYGLVNDLTFMWVRNSTENLVTRAGLGKFICM